MIESRQIAEDSVLLHQVTGQFTIADLHQPMSRTVQSGSPGVIWDFRAADLEPLRDTDALTIKKVLESANSSPASCDRAFWISNDSQREILTSIAGHIGLVDFAFFIELDQAIDWLLIRQ